MARATASNPHHSDPTDRSTGRPRDEKIDAAVKKAVLELLNEKGYGRLTMEEIARRAGTSKPSLRRRWRSRPELVVTVLLEAIGPAPTPDTGCTYCDLVAGIGALGTAFTSTVERRALPGLVADLAEDRELERVFFDTFFHPRRATTAQALHRGVERGDLRADIDVDLLLDMLGSVIYYRVLFGHLPVTKSLAEDLVDIVLRGVSTEGWRHDHARQETT